MPEGDVLARIAARFTEVFGGEEVAQCDLRWPTLSDIDLVGQRFGESTSYGKHVFTHFSSGLALHTHLRMDGVWRISAYNPISRFQRHTVRAVLSSPGWTAVGYEIGMMDLIHLHDIPRFLSHLGPDLMAAEPDFDACAQNLATHSEREIGACLLDQTIAAGIGTIYMAETLWHYSINPWTRAGAIIQPEQLFRTASALMRRSARAQALTATGDTRPGWRSHVHGRQHKPCRRCGTPIARSMVGTPPLDRPAFYCPKCQPFSDQAPAPIPSVFA